MKMSNKLFSAMVAVASLTHVSPVCAEINFLDRLPPGARLLDTTTRTVSGEKTLQLLKYEESQTGSIKYLVLDSSGKTISDTELYTPSIVDSTLKSKLYEMDENDAVDVVVALSVEDSFTPEKESGSMKGNERKADYRYQGKLLSAAQVESNYQKRRQAKLEARHSINFAKVSTLKSILDLVDIDISEISDEQFRSKGKSIKLTLTKNSIEKISTHKNVLGIELELESGNGIDDAMLDTRIDPYALNYSGRSGSGIGIYMTETGCSDAGYISNYTNLGSTSTDVDHANVVASIIREISPDAYLYCRPNATLPLTSDLDGVSGNPPIHIATRSHGYWGSSNYGAYDRDWDNLVYEDGVATFILAGNSGNGTDNIWSPGKGYNVVTVGSYIDSTDTIASSSSALDPVNTGNQKPELSAPGVSINVNGYTNQSGTSFATPHAAAFTADFMSPWLMFRPAATKAYLLATSRKSVSGGSDAAGVGGLDFYDLYYAYDNHYWTGPNNSFQGFDSEDVNPNNGFIDREFYMSSSVSSVRVAFAWLNDGDYTYSHRNGAFPMGMDMDIYVRDPNGKLVGSSTSIDNPYEIVEFDPTVSGTYIVQIKRTANRDSSSAFYAGLSINR